MVRDLVYPGSGYRGMFPAVRTQCIPGFLVMVPGTFIDDTILSIAKRAGEQDNISGSRTHNFRFYGRFFH